MLKRIMDKKPVLIYYNHDCFTQVDDTVLCHLTHDFKVIWFYQYESMNKKIMRYNPEKAKLYAERNGITLEVVDPRMRLRDPRNILFYRNVAKKINEYNPDIVYNCDPFLFWSFCFRRIKCNKKVLGIHDVSLHSYKNTKSSRIIQFVKEYWLKRFKYILTFSNNQHDLLNQRFGKESYMVGMSYKSFGGSSIVAPPIDTGVKLLFFGSINEYKGLDLLIKALEELRVEGVNNLTLSIAGRGSSWTECESLIKTPDMYNLQVRFIENNEIPDLMCSHHFIVLPYKNATQSGPLVTALGYGLPVIAPSYGCFTDIFDEDSAVLYQQGELKDALWRVSQMSEDSYIQLRNKVDSKRADYSEEKIAANYIYAFNDIIEDEI